MGLFNVAKTAYYSLRYGKQIGKTSANGCMAFKKGNVVTGLNKNGKVISTIKTETNGNTTFVDVRKPCADHYGYNKSHALTEISRTKDGNKIDYHSITYQEGYENSRELSETTYRARNGKVHGTEYTDYPHVPGHPCRELEDGGYERVFGTYA